jgi:hypothetical protein
MKRLNGMAMAMVAALVVATGCGGASTASGTIGSSGGALQTARGTKLTVPAGALAEDTRITVTDVEDNGRFRVTIEPESLAFSQRGRLHVEVENRAGMKVFEQGASGEIELEDQRHQGESETEVEIEVEVEHGGEFEAHDGAALSCPAGQELEHGQCQAHRSGGGSGGQG